MEEKNDDLEYIQDWDKKGRGRKGEEKNRKEQSWELYRICKKYLEDNSKDWEKRREMREKKKERKIRLEKVEILRKQARMNALERNVEKGLEKIPVDEKKKILEDERRKERLTIKESKEDLWKLRKKEKKIETTATIEKIRKLGNIAEKVKVILDREKEISKKRKK